jgi:hypothetical protein
MAQQEPKSTAHEQRGLVSDVASNVIAGGIVAGAGTAAKAAVSKVAGKGKK